MFRTAFAALISAFLFGCGFAPANPLPTPMPAEFIPTAIAMTMAALRPTEDRSATPAPSPAPLESSTPTPTPSPTREDLPTPTLMAPTSTLAAVTMPATATATPNPDAPVADVQIFQPGHLSKVVSPLHVTGYLKPGAEGLVWLELYGEDGRLLVRQIRTYYGNPGARVNLSMNLDFEIAAAAEVGRVVVYVKDAFERITALNSVDVILLSLGDADPNPASAADQAIILQEPRLKALVSGGTLVVSGLAKTGGDQPLMAELRDEANQVVGYRQVGVSPPGEDGYGFFTAEVPYQVDALTPVRLVIYEPGSPISEMKHLTSREIMISP